MAWHEAVPLREFVGQRRLVEPLIVQEFSDIRLKWNKAAGKVHELSEELARLRWLAANAPT